MSDCLHIKETCTPKQSPKTYEQFSVCLLEGTITYDGVGLTFSKNNLLDGTFNRVRVTNGCPSLVNVVSPIPSYTPPPCLPTPTPCLSTSVSVSPDPSNLIVNGIDGLNARVYMQVNGLPVSGAGTRLNPLTVSLGTTGGSTNIVAGTGIDINTISTGTVVELEPIFSGNQTFGDITFNKYGQAVSYLSVSTPNSNIISVLGAQGITAQTVSGVATVSLNTITKASIDAVPALSTAVSTQANTIVALQSQIVTLQSQVASLSTVFTSLSTRFP